MMGRGWWPKLFCKPSTAIKTLVWTNILLAREEGCGFLKISCFPSLNVCLTRKYFSHSKKFYSYMPVDSKIFKFVSNCKFGNRWATSRDFVLMYSYLALVYCLLSLPWLDKGCALGWPNEESSINHKECWLWVTLGSMGYRNWLASAYLEPFLSPPWAACIPR